MSTAIYSHPDCLRHEMGDWHPESPARLRAIEDQLILARIDGFIERADAPLAAEAAILRNHTQSALDLVRDNLPTEAGAHYPLDGDTSICRHSYQAALRAAGAAIAATDAVLAGTIDNAFCAVRPPGHHARPGGAMGFCLFNNVAIAVRHALDVHGLERVAIVDFDVHDGNGTREAFGGDERVLIASFYQHPFYPYSEPEAVTPTRINVPVPAYSGGDVIRELVQAQWLPALEAFRPQMLFISAGFDAHREDDLGGMLLVEADYAWMTHRLVEVANRHAGGRIVSVLEGGYNLSALGRSVVAHVKALADLD